MADNAETIRRIYEGLAGGDVAPLLGAPHPEVEWNEAEHFTYWPGRSFVGPDAVL